MQRHLRSSTDDASRAVFADLLAPIYVHRREFSKVTALIDVLSLAGWSSAASSFSAICAAYEGRRETALRAISRTLLLNEVERDDVMRFRVLQRLALATFYLHQYERASDFALASAAICTHLGAWRAASAGYSILYSISHGVTGDFVEADRYAQLCREAAFKTGDASFYYSALVAEFELAVQFGDEQRIEGLQAEIKSKRFPQQYTERFPLVISSALLRGSHDLVGMRTILEVFRDAADQSRGEWSYCTALIGLSYVASYDDAKARSTLRESIAHLGRASVGIPAYEQQYRRVARALVAAAYGLLGDEVLSKRILSVREMESTSTKCLANADHLSLESIDANLIGIAKVVENAGRSRQRGIVPANLTSAEFEVLKLLNSGWNAGRIARDTQRSVNTIYNHIRALLDKLDATHAAEAVAIARSRGMLP